MAGTTTFEVYVLSGSRWEIHSRFPATKMDDAIQDAKTQEKIKRIDGVKVVKETFDPELGLSKESLVYKSPGLTHAMLKGGGPSEKSAPPARSSSSSSGPRMRTGGGGGPPRREEAAASSTEEERSEEHTV